MSVATVIMRGFAIGGIAGVVSRGFLSGAAPAPAVDTHDGGGDRRKPWNKQPLPTLAQLRRLLGLDKRATPVEIEERAETLEEVAEAIEGDAPPPAEWTPPELPPAVGPSPQLLALLQRELETAHRAIIRAENEARRIALARYEQSMLDLRAAIKARAEAEEEEELVTLIAAHIM